MAASIAGVFEESLSEKILSSKVLLVGAGGIGCEILKNLVLSGFKDIEIIDLDTIDVSNLNRQFLFHREHVGQSKAEVARQSALSFNPNTSIKAYHDSITGSAYGLNFFEKFTIVLNALDNKNARNYVNRLCLYSKVPLIESGTAGYDGQVELIMRGKTQCYECTPKPVQKTFPGCTIRNTPSELIHCVVWAKHLFNQLFGEFDAEHDVSPDTIKSTDQPEPPSDDDILEERRAISTRLWANNCNYDAQSIFTKLFYSDIKYLLSMENLWESREKPTPLKWEDDAVEGSSEQTLPSTNGTTNPDQKIWTIEECKATFKRALKVIGKEFVETGELEWDKDNKDAMDFVAAAANIRASIFKIHQKSRFEIKSMAGNIIAAIATTNAITAGMVVFKAFKVLREQYDKCQSVYMRLRPNARNQLLVVERNLIPPNPKCFVCGESPTAVLTVDTNRLTCGQLRDDVLIKTLSMIEPDVTIDSKGIIVISSEPEETSENDNKTLVSLSIVDGTLLDVDDFVENYKVKVIIKHRDYTEGENELFEINAEDTNTIKEANEKKREQNQKDDEINSSKPAYESDEDDVRMLEEVEIESKKRKDHPATEEIGEPSTKRAKTDEPSNGINDDDDDDDLCIIDDD